jgi:RimJ/RimL family protein N-acetyltransferase
VSVTPARLEIPELLTERLRLRAFEARDIDAYAPMVEDPEIARHLGDGRTLTRADAWRQLAMFMGHWALRGFGIWAVEERATGAFIGRIGCFEPEGWPGFEIGYVLSRSVWGRGYAREGAAAALRFARDTLKRREIISVIRPANIGSIRVAESLGAVRGETIEFFGAPAVVYRYSPPGGESTASTIHIDLR